ncbi:ATP-binding cassette domain-containing protein [Alteromonas sediminis]|uniref:ATP-binding cassette domain-containing protein n=1 Tax=Alteromonas sediminis TaxID=2259342 RepID=A0A3N5Y4K2_9ALTE|nr:ABC transporter transmembrane domain-containing protein [Alteromonas sediminis]RPJ68500.1 ATP-binding cassette domain-containing protein [Alteromonas sediminis]
MHKQRLSRWFFTLLRPYLGKACLATLALIIAASSWLLLGQAIRYGIDAGFVNQSQDAIRYAALGLLGITVLISFATYWRFYLMTWLGEKVSADIRNQVYAHLLKLGPAFFANTRTGEVISRFTSDTSVLQTVIGMSFSMAIRSALTFIGSLALMLTASTTLTIAVLLSVPLILVPLRVLAPKLRKYARASQDRVADIGAHIDQSLHEIVTVQAYTAEQREARQFAAQVDEALSTALKRIHIRAWLIALVMGLSMGAIVGIGWLGIEQVQSGTLSVGELTAFLFYAVMAGGSIATVSEVIGDIQRGAGASERLLELLNTDNPIAGGTTQKLALAPSPPAIHFNAIHFTYPNTDTPLFNGLTLDIAPGEQVALVGPSGAGKTSLFNLLMRFWEAQKGVITLNDTDIAGLSFEALRSHIAVVDQSAVVFADTVTNNIRYGRPDASDDEVKQAAEQAYADSFIAQLPNGYDTLLGERGVNLSGGQRQRIAIARAILADRPILLLDEATSALDAESEANVQRALKHLMASRTTLVIAHRLATVKDVDRIVVMHEGKIAATGTHDDLLSSSDLYQRYAQLQFID